ncbi:MAG: DUF1223 domain-containing protein [Alkalilacustris sp.]
MALPSVGLAEGARAEGARAEGARGVVVELFTSQGCVACPPADALMARLAERPGVIALSLHVDIWDYLGWADPFADPAFTRRQKAYARASGSRSIFTPQMIVGGVHKLAAPRGMDLADLLRAEAARPERVRLSLRREGETLRIGLEAEPPLEKGVRVDLVRYTPHATVLIEGGENAGLEVTQHNIVTLWQEIAQWDGTAPLTLEVRLEGAEPAVVIVQEHGPGRILAASVAP